MRFPEGKRKKACMENAWNGKPGKYRMVKITERAEMEMRKGKPLRGKTAGEHGNRKAEKMSNESSSRRS